MTCYLFFSLCLGNNKIEKMILRLTLGSFSQLKNMRVYLYCIVKDYQELSNHLAGNTAESSNQDAVLLYTQREPLLQS